MDGTVDTDQKKSNAKFYAYSTKETVSGIIGQDHLVSFCDNIVHLYDRKLISDLSTNDMIAVCWAESLYFFLSH